VVLSELLNERAPAAWLMAPRGDAQSGGEAGACPLAALAAHCLSRGLVLTYTSHSKFDLVLLPREAGTHDGVTFVVFATRVGGAAGWDVAAQRSQHGTRSCQGRPPAHLVPCLPPPPPTPQQVEGVAFIARTVGARRLAVVLDLDSTVGLRSACCLLHPSLLHLPACAACLRLPVPART
jgi:hypothetical protein